MAEDDASFNSQAAVASATATGGLTLFSGYGFAMAAALAVGSFLLVYGLSAMPNKPLSQRTAAVGTAIVLVVFLGAFVFGIGI